jgi:hypothetical protein
LNSWICRILYNGKYRSSLSWTINYSTASNSCSNLWSDGRRLPTMQELCPGWDWNNWDWKCPNYATFRDTLGLPGFPYSYWSSTPSGSGGNWIMNITNGRAGTNPQDSSYGVVCIHD